MAPTGTHIEANRLRIYYEIHGEGEPLLLVHCGTATSQSWASHLPAFTEHFQVFAPDSRGHGRTDNPTGELSYRVMADDVAALVGALGLQRPLVQQCSTTCSRLWCTYLKPAPVVARVATCMPKLRTPIEDWLEREIAVTTYLAVRSPAPSPARGYVSPSLGAR